jgi:hypothetical protein
MRLWDLLWWRSLLIEKVILEDPMRLNKLFTLAGLAAMGLAALSYADPVVTVPYGLTPGEQYRLVFVTNETTTATSTNIADYNTFVNDVANAIGPYSSDGSLLASLGLTWTALASTEAVSAITNIGVDNVPVYDLVGSEVARSDSPALEGLWGGELDSLAYISENGNNLYSEGVWTGTNVSGFAVTGFALGDSDVFFGATDGIYPFPLGSWVVRYYAPATDEAHLYGISSVITYEPNQSSTPEPGTVSLMMLGGMFLVGKVRKLRSQPANGTIPSTSSPH